MALPEHREQRQRQAQLLPQRRQTDQFLLSQALLQPGIILLQKRGLLIVPALPQQQGGQQLQTVEQKLAALFGQFGITAGQAGSQSATEHRHHQPGQQQPRQRGNRQRGVEQRQPAEHQQRQHRRPEPGGNKAQREKVEQIDIGYQPVHGNRRARRRCEPALPCNAGKQARTQILEQGQCGVV